MPDALQDHAALWPFVLLAAGAVVTYAWRALGVVLSGRIDPDGAAFEWAACVAFALLAGLVARMIVLPMGIVAETALLDRLLATAAAIGAYFGLSRRNMLIGVAAGSGVLILLTWARAALGL
jgi:branched-subunit amino acid transport protein